MNGDALERVQQALSAAGCSVRNRSARCPAHDDHHPSLSVTHNGTDRVLLNCQAGCDPEEVVQAIGLTMADLYDQAREDDKPTSIKRHVVARYDYTDPHGEVLFQKVRYWPKDFRVRRPDRRGGWQWGIGDAQRVLYRWPEVIAAIDAGQTVYVVEGEKSAERLATEGAVGTCNFDGAARADHTSKWRPAYGDALKGAHVIVVVDNDPPGFAHGRAIRDDLTGKAASVRVVRGLVMSKGADLDDHLDAGHTLDELADVDLDTPEPPATEEPPDGDAAEAEEDPSSWEPVDLAPYLDGTFVRAEPGVLYRIDGVGLLYPGKVHWTHGESESGKSWVAQIATVRVMRAGGRVLYLDHESDPQEVVSRFLALGATREEIRERLLYVRPDESSMVVRNARVLDRLLDDEYTLAVVDGVTDALGLDKASTKDTDEVAAWMRRMPRRISRETGAAVVAIDHVTKDPDTRGRFAIGSQAKMGGLDGAAYVVEPNEPLGRGMVGEIVLRIAKDRPGSLRGHGGVYRKSDRTQEIARIRFDATNPDAIVVIVGLPKVGGPTVDGEPAPFRPTTLMEKVSLVLEAHPEGLSSTRVQQLVTGKKDTIAQALEVLVIEGYVDRTETVRGNAKTYTHTSQAAYRQSLDPAADRGPGHQDPDAAADRVPGPGATPRGPGGPGEPAAALTGSGTRSGPGGDPVDQRKHRDPVGTRWPGPQDQGPGGPEQDQLTGVSDLRSVPESLTDSDRELDDWVRANVTRDPKPVGTITADVSTCLGATNVDAFRVQASLERLATRGEVTRHAATGNGPATWSLPTGTTAA